jgi:hypothetical protein
VVAIFGPRPLGRETGRSTSGFAPWDDRASRRNVLLSASFPATSVVDRGELSQAAAAQLCPTSKIRYPSFHLCASVAIPHSPFRVRCRHGRCPQTVWSDLNSQAVAFPALPCRPHTVVCIHLSHPGLASFRWVIERLLLGVEGAGGRRLAVVADT